MEILSTRKDSFRLWEVQRKPGSSAGQQIFLTKFKFRRITNGWFNQTPQNLHMRVTPSPARCEGLHGRLRRIEAGGKVVWRRSNCLRNPKTIKKAHGSLLVDKQLLIIHLM